ncbi:MAG: hypothetical protein IPL78_21235 [Chloroflexi bacterium]|nr:hypothetical protein [Chloroflexota bacterium]
MNWIKITVDFPKPELRNNGFNVYFGHPRLTLANEQASQLEEPGQYGWAEIEYSDKKTGFMFLGKLYDGSGQYDAS